MYLEEKQQKVEKGRVAQIKAGMNDEVRSRPLSPSLSRPSFILIPSPLPPSFPFLPPFLPQAVEKIIKDTALLKTV